MLFLAKATALALLAFQANALPAGKNVKTPSIHVVDAPLSNVEARGTAGDASAVVDSALGLVQYFEEKHTEDMEARERLLKDTMDNLMNECPPEEGYHRFAFIQYKGFEWSIDDVTDMAEYSVPYERKDIDAKEHFKFIAFKGHGTLNKNGYDGGWANWAYSGEGQRDNAGQGDIVEWF